MAKNKEIYVISSHTKKVFANMRRQGQGFSRNVTTLFETMMVTAQEAMGEVLAKVHSPSSEIPVAESIPTPFNDPLPIGEDSIQLNELMIFCTSLQQHVLDLEEANIAQAKEIAKLKKRERSIKDIDQDAEIALVDEAQGRLHDADLFGVDDLEVTVASVEDSATPNTATTADVNDELTLAKTLIAIKAAKPKVISTVITTPRSKDIVFHEQVQDHIPTVSSAKDKGKEKMIEPKKPLKRKIKLHLMKTWQEKNVEETLKKTQVEVNSKRAGQELEQESAKKQKLAEQEQAKGADDDITELKRCLKIVPEDDDDVAIEATPLFSKFPTIVDYKIYREGKKSYFKIIRADGNTQNYLTFGTMFKNFNREDFEVLRSIVKERFKKSKPVDDMDNLLFQTLKTMFEPHVEDIIWKYQQGAVKVNN
uniref:Uncharacterized protein n=1 Tax=Tanacetum cinerariifolium TaxID=118510 RepID=A0A6L2NBU6_TANCI|nr:hypothetical protein [Tanacetum cinerariifolium]